MGRRSLRTKLILSFSLGVFLSLTLLGYVQIRSTRRALTEAANEFLLTAATQTATRLDHFITSNLEFISAEARLGGLAACLDQLTQGTQDPGSCREAMGLLQAFQQRSEVFIASYGLLDRRGRDVLDTRAALIGGDESERAYFTAPLGIAFGRRPYVSPVEFEDDGGAYLHFSHRIVDASGKVLGVLRARYRASVLQHLVAQDAELAGARSFPLLVDENHLRLAHGLVSGGEAAGVMYKTLVPLDLADLASLRQARRMPRRPSNELAAHLPDLDRAIFEATAGPRPYFTASLGPGREGVVAGAVTGMTTRPWWVVFVKPQEAFLEPVRAQTRDMWILASIIAVLAAAGAAFVGSGLARPILRLTAVARAIAGGNLGATAPTRSRDEIGALAEAFNSMTTQLRRRIETENLLASLSRRFIAAPVEQTDFNALQALEALGRFVGADRGYVLWYTPGAGPLSCSLAWQGEGTVSRPDDTPWEQSPDGTPWLDETLRDRREIVHVPNVDDLPEEAGAERGAWQRRGIRSVVCVPMVIGEGVSGLVGFDTLGHRRSWSDDDLRVLRVATEILTNAFARRRAQDELARSEQRYALAQRAAGIGSWDWDLATGDLFWSEGVAPLLGLTPGLFGAKYEAFLEAVHSDDRPRVEAAVRASRKTGAEYAVEHRILLPDGSTRWISGTGDVIRDEAGAPERLVGVVQDVTDRKRAEEELRRAHDELDAKVRDRTAKLAAAKEQAEAASRAKSQFLASVSHELRTPLNIILGYTQLVLDGIDGEVNEAQRASLERVERSAGALVHLVDEVLDLSRIEAEKLELSAQDFELRECLDEVLAEFVPAAERQGLHLTWSLAEDAPVSLRGDPLRLQQVLRNLVGNALKFTPAGRITVHAERAGQEGPHTWVRFTVADTGIGIAPEKHAAIFEAFTQADESFGRAHHGVGLGLTICKRLVNLMGGRIGVESATGQGSTFTFTARFETP